jgi:hypothetical protein
MTAIRIEKSTTGMDEARSANPVLADAVKLVVWDLDDTFWKGVLSKEPVTPVPENIELVKRLAARGIVSSICSKNARESAVNELQKLGVWDYLVLPSVSFQSKGSSTAAGGGNWCQFIFARHGGNWCQFIFARQEKMN